MKKSQKSNLKKTPEILSHKLFLVAVFLIAFLTPFFINGNKLHKVVLSDTGFSPQRINIKRGEKVTWEISGKNSHWPASNDHPTHTIYPDGGGCIGSKLDACRAMKKGENFTFEFDRQGSWVMHDHVHPELLMTVDVAPQENNSMQIFGWAWGSTKSKEKVTDSRDLKHLQLFSERQKPFLKKFSEKITVDEAGKNALSICSDLTGAKFREAQHCYSEVIYFVAKNNDQKFAYDTIAYLRKNTNAPTPCHLMAHGLGNGIYDRDPADWQNAIGKASPECSYGEIHGILEGYASSGNNPFEKDKITTICIKNPNWACYHGLGHVMLAVMGDDLYKTAEMCYLFTEPQPKSNCLNGVFMEHMIGQTLEEHGLVTAERRKHYPDHLPEFITLCESQTKKDYIRACWVEMIHASVAKYKADPEKVYALCEQAPTADATKGCKMHALAELVPSKGYDPFALKYICERPVPNDPNFQRDCYQMIASVVIVNTTSKVDAVSSFCASLALEFQSGCINVIRRQAMLLRRQDPQKADSICQTVSPENRSVCSGKTEESFGNSEE